MAQCVSMDASGVLTPLASAPSECAGFVLLSGAEYVAVSPGGIFATPSAVDAGTYFAGPLILIVFLFMAARIAGSVVSMFHR